jgi:23S rRNA (adenine2030-N6)-methyltransferase
MNYRHAYHAGNFADLLKHAALIGLLDHFVRRPGPLMVIDTHAGAGSYDLTDSMALKTGEAAQGIGRLAQSQELPRLLAQLTQTVAEFNSGQAKRLYPGSPAIAVARLRSGDRLLACELREDEQASLRRTVLGFPGAKVMQADGYETAASAMVSSDLLVLIDPPFEASDDYERCAQVSKDILSAHPKACVAIWMPLKDLETLDGFLRRIEPCAPAGSLVVELRMRPLTRPMTMNGCALVILGAPEGFDGEIVPVCTWIATHLGDSGAQGRVYPLG